ncbi:AAA family ATPase [Methanospirillum lacunae]|uniref:AAA family ATPase n=1 Tax=Methanospirillum lacunae TaxID=668570 RepID=A0A2V2MR76_9EURY|nr:AAA family ATPase [Methanospirillum lacunae]PWR70642.1 AAA family ATPase [Methanospirillum lacunae]
MEKIVLYYGPNIGFKKYIQEETDESDITTTLSSVVRKIDEFKNIFKFISENPDESKIQDIQLIRVGNLISSSDEYAGIQEHAILNFEILLSKLEIKNIYFQNPPKHISDIFNASYPDITEIEKYCYVPIDERKIYTIHENFDKRIIGQPKAKKSLLRSLVRLTYQKNKKPLVILFYGPSGVGKTETAKYLAEILGGQLFRKQFSMFQNNDYIYYLFGGEHSKNSFAKEILEREANVLLLDEFDKVNPLFHSAFYQLFDEGIFEDQNYKVNVGDAVIICTSNYLDEDEIKKQLGDPIYSRIEACIKFDSLSTDSLKGIIEQEIEFEWKKLRQVDKKKIDKNEVKSHFCNHLSKFSNVRIIKSSINLAISEKILERIIERKGK